MTDIEEALALLAAPCTDERFFQRALKALALVTQCRWAAFGRPSQNRGMAEVVAFCDLKHSIPGFEFNLKGSPCETIYQLRYPDTHILYPKDLQSLFPNFKLIKDLGANSYQAELILADDGTPIGHILVMDTEPQADSIKSREFFRLLAQRIGVEYKRLLISRELALHKQMIAVSEQFMSFVDINYRYHVVSKGYETMFGRAVQEFVGKTVEEIHGEEVFSQHLKPLLDRSLAGETINTQTWIHPPNQNAPIYLNVHHNPYYSESGNLIGVIVSAHDISEIHAAKVEIEHFANHDPLTGLANRRALFEEIQHKINAQKAGQLQLAVMYIDLDGFKQINDRFGHHQGDKVLVDVATRIQDCAGSNELISRIGGDEFVVLASFTYGLPQSSYQAELEALSERLLTQLRMNIEVNGQHLPVSASIGSYIADDDDSDLSAIICKADKEMYNSKKAKCGFENLQLDSDLG
ncbi:GGDEF domain-containing protein [Shewanella canadensis]|uniref:GGDEF domain-containing protein n=1 Tax=Shewanella canadensis TaxID=271096 RepID=A0A3S0ITX3_9GAMM|nr:GGDEF domain-containing protein [Shewanella canadensis]RTR39639.1 GGDEF domain-containing protein [Shewanella canadensis]